MDGRVLYVVVSAGGAITEVPKRVVVPSRGAGWTVYVLATDRAAAAFPEVMVEFETAIGAPVRTDFHTATGYSLPDPDAVVVAPATYNTIVKMAAGLADSYVLTRLAEQVGRRTPLALLPAVNDDFAAHPRYADAVAGLSSWGVKFLDGPEDVATWLGRL